MILGEVTNAQVAWNSAGAHGWDDIGLEAGIFHAFFNLKSENKAMKTQKKTCYVSCLIRNSCLLSCLARLNKSRLPLWNYQVQTFFFSSQIVPVFWLIQGIIE
jgi:hypothetical protein